MEEKEYVLSDKTLQEIIDLAKKDNADLDTIKETLGIINNREAIINSTYLDFEYAYQDFLESENIEYDSESESFKNKIQETISYFNDYYKGNLKETINEVISELYNEE